MTKHQNIPASMAVVPQWLCYRLVDTGKGRLSKPPVSPRTGHICAKNDEHEFATLRDALVGVEMHDLDGVGFVFSGDFVAIDLDDCFSDDGRLTPVAQNVFDHFTGTYWEYSPSGNGLHGFMRGVKPNDRTKDAINKIEVYSGYNFVTVTGDWVEGTAADALEMQDELDWLYAEYLPPTIAPNAAPIVVEHGERSPDEWLWLGLSKDEKLASLYNQTQHDGDESSTDFSLMSKLAYWLNRDEAAISAAFMDSPWVKSKDRAHAKKMERKDYLTESVAKAAMLCNTTAWETNRQYETKAIRFFTLTPQDDGTDKFVLDNYTDLGNAEAMAKIYGEVLCYTPEWGWCFFNGVRWETDVSHRAMEAAREIAHALMTSAENWLEKVKEQIEAEEIDPTSDEAKNRMKPPLELYKHALKSQSEHGITAMVNLNRAYMMMPANAFNADPWLLNVPSGVVDLKSGELMPHDAKYRLTTMTTVSPETGDKRMFDTFLDKVFCQDDQLIRFVQVALGSALVGKVYTENLIIANGNGANGKSTLFNTMQSILGDYATAINPDLLMSSKASERQVGMAMLEGKRFAVAQETEEGQRLKSSSLKQLVSTDTIIAKRLYKDPHEFVPAHMLVLSTNHLPKISSTDVGTWRRILVLPFNATFTPDEIITDFASLLIEREGEQILQWAMEGAMAFWEMGCNISIKPQAIVDASQEYRESEDWLTNFLNECCVVTDQNDMETFVRHNDLYMRYQHYARDCNDYVRSSNAFGRAMQGSGWQSKAKHYDPDRKSTVKIWYGLDLQSSPRSITIVGSRKNREDEE